MKEFQYTVKDACGIHARPAGLLVKTVKGFASTATREKDGKSCDMRKLMALMGMGVKQGETVDVYKRQSPMRAVRVCSTKVCTSSAAGSMVSAPLDRSSAMEARPLRISAQSCSEMMPCRASIDVYKRQPWRLPHRCPYPP